jgi:hypothetical protein
MDLAQLLVREILLSFQEKVLGRRRNFLNVSSERSLLGLASGLTRCAIDTCIYKVH